MSSTPSKEHDLSFEFANPVSDLELSNMKNNPSEYVRIMTGLSSEKGEVELNDKEILKRGKNALHKPVFSGLGFSKKKGEVKASQIFQSSVHDHIQN